MKESQVIITIDLGSIFERPNFNHRAAVVDDAFSEMVASVKKQGVLHPPLLRRRKSDGYYIIFGHRRIAAARAAGLHSVECQCLPWRPETEVLAGDLCLSLTENLKRRDVGPLERANAFRRLQSLGMTVAQIARAVGVEPSYISRELSFLSLPSSVQVQIEKGGLPKQAAVPLVRLASAGVSAAHIRSVAKSVQGKPSYVASAAVNELIGERLPKGHEVQQKSDMRELTDWACGRYGSLESALKRLREIEGGGL